jgi:uncharacterized protein
MTTHNANPVAQSERILTLDMIRGIAVLGILLMNILLFSTPETLANDPSLRNEFGTINYYIWYAVAWIFDGTQRALFSLLFGAGIILFISRQEKKFSGLTPADYFFKRQLWLILFSLIDVYILLWNGDILLDYACFGMMLFVFRKLSPRALIIAAGVCVLLMTARENRNLYERKAMIRQGESLASIDTTVTKLTFQQKEALDEMLEFKAHNEPEAKLKSAKESIDQMTTSYASVYEARTGDYTGTLVKYIYFSLWDVLIFMMLGMAFFKLGILTGSAPTRVYIWMCIIGLSVGLMLSWVMIQYVNRPLRQLSRLMHCRSPLRHLRRPPSRQNRYWNLRRRLVENRRRLPSHPCSVNRPRNFLPLFHRPIPIRQHPRLRRGQSNSWLRLDPSPRHRPPRIPR